MKAWAKPLVRISFDMQKLNVQMCKLFKKISTRLLYRNEESNSVFCNITRMLITARSKTSSNSSKSWMFCLSFLNNTHHAISSIDTVSAAVKKIYRMCNHGRAISAQSIREWFATTKMWSWCKININITGSFRLRQHLGL